MKLGLKGKFVLIIGIILTLSYTVLMIYNTKAQNRLVLGLAKQQAKILCDQILITRQWVADHNGIFIIRQKDEAANPYLDNPVIRSVDNQVFIKRNPAMVTRELSEYASKSGFSWFKVTSLEPVNPDNAPDDFERISMEMFARGAKENISISNQEHGRVLRYATPLLVKTSCLQCHAGQGYEVGDIRGALSISVPVAWADKVISKNNRNLILYGMTSTLFTIIVLIFFFNTLVAYPLRKLSSAMKIFPGTRADQLSLPRQNDEIGLMSEQFKQLCCRLEQSREELIAAGEQALHAEKLAALGQLTAGVAHEINNPLGGVRNCVHNMQQDPENLDLHRRYLPLLDKGLRRIEHTMRQLLNYGRNEPLQLQKINLDKVIRDCFSLLKYRLDDIELILSLNLDETLCLNIEAVKQIVMNISLNSIDAMESGGTLTVTSQRKEATIILCFTDTGCGIAEDILSKIFEPFFTTKEVNQGTGLGLAVTYSLIKKLGGSISVKSVAGLGSSFTITFPVNLQCKNSEDAASKPPERVTGNG